MPTKLGLGLGLAAGATGLLLTTGVLAAASLLVVVCSLGAAAALLTTVTSARGSLEASFIAESAAAFTAVSVAAFFATGSVVTLAAVWLFAALAVSACTVALFAADCCPGQQRLRQQSLL